MKKCQVKSLGAGNLAEGCIVIQHLNVLLDEWLAIGVGNNFICLSYSDTVLLALVLQPGEKALPRLAFTHWEMIKAINIFVHTDKLITSFSILRAFLCFCSHFLTTCF